MCRAVTKTYGVGSSAVTALRGIDLEVREGELMMLVGPSGCGKTTLISVIAGILDRDGGETIGFVFQAFNLLPTLTSAENASIPLLIRGMPRGEALATAKDMLAQVG